MPDIGRFYAQRALRLYPLHLCLMAFLAVSVLAASAIGVPINTDQVHSWAMFPYVFLPN
jgi:peptidoglycan/LPS O-acetylase OafA/YrhL